MRNINNIIPNLINDVEMKRYLPSEMRKYIIEACEFYCQKCTDSKGTPEEFKLCKDKIDKLDTQYYKDMSWSPFSNSAAQRHALKEKFFNEIILHLTDNVSLHPSCAFACLYAANSRVVSYGGLASIDGRSSIHDKFIKKAREFSEPQSIFETELGSVSSKPYDEDKPSSTYGP